jgi:putative ABC transport system permease protein
MFRDLRYAWRALVKQPAFTLVAILVLALGIGANTAIFSVVDAVLLRPLPYPDPDRLVSVSTFWRKTGLRATVSAPDFHDFHDQATTFAAMAAYLRTDSSVSLGGAADYAVVSRVTPEFFAALGARAEIGRLPAGAEQEAGGPLTAVVSHAFWTTRLGGDPAAIGRTVKYSERVYTIVGVLDANARFPAGTDIWTPWWVIPETTSRSAHNYRAIGRLKPTPTLEQAQTELDAIARRLERAYPTSNEDKGVAVDRLLDQTVRNVRGTLGVIFGVVVVVLLIACANVSTLMLVRASTRAREIAIRAAIGASRGRVIRQLITESALLAIIAGGAGVLVAAWGVRGLIAIAPAGLPRLNEVTVDMRVLLFASAVSLTASFAFGLVPALLASRVNLNEILRQSGHGSSGGAGSSRLRASLIVFETAAAVVLVIGAGLLIRSFSALSRVDMGFRPDHLLLADTVVPSASLDAARRAVRFYQQLLPELAAVPGVRSVAAVYGVPTQVRSNGGYTIEGGPTFAQMGMRSPQAVFTVATPGYFSTMNIPVRRGRDFSDRDSEEAPLVAIVNQALVRASFENEDPIGHRIQSGLDRAGFMTIVGIVADVRAGGPSLNPQPQIYMPFQQHPTYSIALTVVIRASGDPLQLTQLTGQKVRALNPDVPAKMTTMDAAIDDAVSAPRFRTILLGTFAVLAVLLAVAGVYGVVSFTVSQRTSEMGLRMALGAQRSDVVRLTLLGGLKLTMAGVAAGWVASLALTRVLASMLFATSERDPLIFAVVPVLLLGVACIASMAPAIRAARVDPAIALRLQ